MEKEDLEELLIEIEETEKELDKIPGVDELCESLHYEETWKGNGEEWDVPEAKENPNCVCSKCGEALGIRWTTIWSTMKQSSWPVMCIKCTEDYFSSDAQVKDTIQRYISSLRMAALTRKRKIENALEALENDKEG